MRAIMQALEGLGMSGALYGHLRIHALYGGHSCSLKKIHAYYEKNALCAHYGVIFHKQPSYTCRALPRA